MVSHNSKVDLAKVDKDVALAGWGPTLRMGFLILVRKELPVRTIVGAVIAFAVSVFPAVFGT